MIGILRGKIKHKIRPTDIDLCICCGAETEYTRDTAIGKRVGYIEGAGQLCFRCYCELYGEGRSGDKNGKDN